jgi:hypothetical protein
MTIREIRTYKIYTRLNTSHERTIRIQESYIGLNGYRSNSYQYGLTKSQEAFMGIHSYRQPKYISECFFKNKPCEPPIVGIYKKLKWIEIEPNKKECKLEWSNCRLKLCQMKAYDIKY